MIGIIGAMEIELEEIKKHLTNKHEITKGIRTYTLGQIENKNVVLVLAGIGKVNAAVTTSKLLEDFDISHLINIGVAGGQKGVKHKDLVISTEVLYHDVDVTSFGSYVHGQMPGMDPTYIADQDLLNTLKQVLTKSDISYKYGKIASGDSFVISKETIKEVNALYDDIYAIEMEAGAIAQVATIYQTPFIIIRSISDILEDEDQNNDFSAFVEAASITAANLLHQLLKVL